MQIAKVNRDYGCSIPLLLMNSPHTEEETKKLIHKYGELGVKILTFQQSEHPYMYKDTLAPFPKSKEKVDCWYPPGSGEVFAALHRCGLLEEFQKQGKEFLFISNVENLGASVDLKLLNCLSSTKDLDFLLEVTNRISTDQAGGFPIIYKDQRVHVLEMSQIPSQFMKKFSIFDYKSWNTNNIWTRIGVVLDMLKKSQLELDFIVKYKSLEGRSVVQVETPAAMSIHSFARSAAVLVPRSRYRPVKNTSDLLQVQSDLFEFYDGQLTMNPKRVPASEPLVKLGEEFKSVDELEKRFKSIPTILELDHLTVSGNVTFGANITLKGTVIIVANNGQRIDIPDGVVLDNKIVTGDLTISDM